ncbi:MAG: TonB-dependent receptor, partial [Acidobacteriaceae bacterium]|nr:TonB-dependent receptor [Acidobacteriaceae bacterium]
IIKNKTFFFADYYGWREFKGQTFINTVPTALEGTGNFSELLPSTHIYDPYTTVQNGSVISRTPYANNTIPAGELNQVGLNVASLYPLPNIPGAGLQNNRSDFLSRSLDDNGGNIRIDHRFSEKDSMFGRYSLEQFNLFDTKGQGGCCIPTPASVASKFNLGPFIAGGQNTKLVASGFAFNETHVFTPTLVNEFIAGVARTNPLTRQSDYGHNAATSLGIMGINLSPNTSGIPTINISNVPGLSDYTSLNGGPAFLPANPRQTSYQLQDNVSWIRGGHSLKFGYRIIRDDVSPFTNTNTRSQLYFRPNLTNNPITGTEGNGLATLLLGFLANGTSSGGTRGFLQSPYYLRVWEHSVFVEDDWKLSPRLTLNLGVRWDLFTPYKEKNNRLTNFDLANLSLVYAGVNASKTADVQTRYNDVGPHVGFAWDVTGDTRTVLRGGFEMSYFPEQTSASNFLGQQVPWAISQNTPAPSTQYPLGAAMASQPTINQPFGTPLPIQPMTTTDLVNAPGNPSVIGQSFANQTPYYETWNFNIERQLGSSMLLELAYAGSRGNHLMFCYNPQEVEPGPSSISSNLRVTIPQIPTFRNILECDPRNNSNYHGFQAKLTKRLSSGLQFLLSYTWSKSLDYGGSAASGSGYTSGPQTITNLKTNYGPSGFDLPQRFVGSWTWDLPFGRSRRYVKSGILSYVIGDWQLGGIATLQSGLPFSVTGSCPNNATNCWPDVIGSADLANRTYSHWYNPAAFAEPCAVALIGSICSQPAFRYGNAGRGILRMPGTYNLDLYTQRIFAIKERVNLQLRLEAFNALNHPIMSVPNQSINPANPAASSTAITGTNGDNRDLEVAIKIVF